jgi:hypothetical protein
MKGINRRCRRCIFSGKRDRENPKPCDPCKHPFITGLEVKRIQELVRKRKILISQESREVDSNGYM